mgnify:CR=1 FL=1
MTNNKGKILILKQREKLLAILMRDNQIVSAQVLKPAEYAVGNIYVGRIRNISENIGAAFVDLGGGYLAFLPLADAKYACLTNRSSDAPLRAGDELIVQISREPMKTKQAGVTTRLSLPGQYAVVGIKTGKKSDGVQVSSKLDRKMQEHFQRQEFLEEIADRYTLTIRTNAGLISSDDPVVAEARTLADTLDHIQKIARTRTCYSRLYQRKPDYVSFVENAYRSEYDEVITDLPWVYDSLKDCCSQNDIPLRLYEDALLPLHKLYSVEVRIQELLGKKVWLKSGGYLVIEPTEALVSIDVNTGKYENGKDKEEVFFRINMEAAEMIASQLRARNLSGMILVDFINLKNREKETALLEHMRRLLKRDPVHANALDMTALGLMELTRKKVSPCLAEQLKWETADAHMQHGKETT